MVGRKLSWLCLASLAATTASCAIVKNAPQLFLYDEPTDGARTRLRLLGATDNAVIYPGTTCNRGHVPGFGRVAFSPLTAHRNLQMPRLSDTPKRSLELYVRSEQPLVLAFDAGASAPAAPCPPAPPGYRMVCNRPIGHGPTCVTEGTFVPQAGQDYEAVLNIASGACSLDIYALVKDADGRIDRRSVPSRSPTCPAEQQQ